MTGIFIDPNVVWLTFISLGIVLMVLSLYSVPISVVKGRYIQQGKYNIQIRSLFLPAISAFTWYLCAVLTEEVAVPSAGDNFFDISALIWYFYMLAILMILFWVVQIILVAMVYLDGDEYATNDIDEFERGAEVVK